MIIEIFGGMKYRVFGTQFCNQLPTVQYSVGHNFATPLESSQNIDMVVEVTLDFFRPRPIYKKYPFARRPFFLRILATTFVFVCTEVIEKVVSQHSERLVLDARSKQKFVSGVRETLPVNARQLSEKSLFGTCCSRCLSFPSGKVLYS